MQIKNKKRFSYCSKSLIIKTILSVLLPIAIVIFFLQLYNTWILYRTYNPKTDALEKNWLASPWPAIKTVFPDIFIENYAAIINVLFSNEIIADDTIPSIKISLENNGLEKLDIENFQYQLGYFNKKQRINGSLKDKKGRFIPIKINMRGTMFDHHQSWKPSLRLRFLKKDLYTGFRNHTLVAPSDGIGFSNWLSNKLSDNWNMLGNKEHFIKLFINGKYFGIYNRIWRLDESLLINSNRLPGPFFRLEPQVKRIFFVGNNFFWNELDGWRAKGVTGMEAKKLLAPPIKIAKNIMTWKSSQKRKELLGKLINLNEYIDNDIFAKFHALLTHSGERHIDGQHNNAFWLDQSSGKLIPIIMDPQGYSLKNNDWGNLHRPIIKSGSAFIDAWLKLPENYLLYIDRLWEVLTSFGSSKSVENIIRQQYNLIQKSLVSDVNFSLQKNPRIHFPITQIDNLVEHLINFVKKRNKWLIKVLTSDEISIIQTQNGFFKLFVDGYSGVVGQRFDGKNFYIKGLNKPINKFSFLPHLNLLENQIEEFPVAYGIYEVEGAPEDFIFSHRLNNKKVNSQPFKYKDYLNVLEEIKGFDQFSIRKPQKTFEVIGPGEMVFKNSKVFNEQQTVKIASGTTIKLGPNVSLIFKGPITIDGSKNKPVKIQPLISNKPFGVVAIVGPETYGSSIKRLEMKGGSIDRYFNLKFTGMLSIHDCPKIEISKSRFGKNFIGDDAVHIVRSEARVISSKFVNSRADSLDWDKVDGLIQNNYFLSPKNDGIDLSMGKVKIIGNYFKNCGDKCISVGEGSNVQVENAKIKECNIGIAIKDKSTLKLKDSTIKNCRIALNSFKKKWRWQEGGKSKVINTQFINSTRADILGDKLSQTIFQGIIPKNLNVKGNIKVESTLK